MTEVTFTSKEGLACRQAAYVAICRTSGHCVDHWTAKDVERYYALLKTWRVTRVPDLDKLRKRVVNDRKAGKMPRCLSDSAARAGASE